MFAGSTAAVAAGALFSVLLAIACVSDLRTRRISNKLNLVLAATGVVFSVAVLPLGTAVTHATLGMLVGLGFVAERTLPSTRGSLPERPDLDRMAERLLAEQRAERLAGGDRHGPA